MVSLFFRIVSILLPLFSATAALELPTYQGLRTSQKPGILEVTFHNTKSTTNLWNEDTLSDLTDLVQRLQSDNETKAVVFRSDVPKYFLNHLDLQDSGPTTASRMVELFFNMTNLRQATIGAVEGVARGAGNEFLISIDMRFATKGHTLLGLPEVGGGAIPCAGGSQYLPRLIGRGRAMEYILSSKDINAGDAERMGWINKAFDTSAEMYAHIDDITSRLALFSLEAIGAAKQSINTASRAPLEQGLEDAVSFVRMLGSPTLQATMAKGLALTRNGSDGDPELFLGDYLPLLYT